MKKYLNLAALLVAIASYGGIVGGTLSVHAQSITLEQRATMQQSLDVLKAKLVNLEMQQGVVPQGDEVSADAAPVVVATPSVTLGGSDVVQLEAALSSFAETLTALQTKIAEDPQYMAVNEAAFVATLQGIGNTLASIGAQLENSDLAMAAPQAAAPAPAQVMPSMNPNPAAATQNPGSNVVPAANNGSAPIVNAPAQTAQASNAFSLGKLNWPLIVVIVLVLAAIAIWLFWDTEEKVVAVKTVANAPQKPMQPFVPQPSATVSQSPLSATIAPQQRKSA